jgi:hypothetical protein
MVTLLTPRASLPYVQDYLDRAQLGDRGSSIAYEDISRTSFLPSGLYVFTGINRLGPAWAELLSGVHRQIHAATGVTPLNHPLRTLRRFELLQALYQAGMNEFRAYGAWEDLSKVRFPVFVRPREQDGGVPKLLHSTSEVEATIGEQLMNGFSLNELLVVEFEDTADEKGKYRKFSAYVVGNRILPVSIDWGQRWVMRSDGVDHDPEMIEEELRFVQENPHAEQLEKIFSLSKTQFGRIDYSVKDGRVQTWEINTLPLLRRPRGRDPMPEEIRALRKPRMDLFMAAFGAAWREVLADVPQGSAFRVTLDKYTLARARVEMESRGVTTEPASVLFPRLRRLLRPIKPILKPIAARILHPILGRRARRSGDQHL